MWVQSLGQEDPLEEVWQPTPVFLPGESHEQKSLAGYSPEGHKESDATEAAEHTCVHIQRAHPRVRGILSPVLFHTDLHDAFG